MNQSSDSISHTDQTLQQRSCLKRCVAGGLTGGLSRHYVWLLPLLLIVLGVVAYAPAANGVFVLDDRAHIYEGDQFKQVLPLAKYLGRRGLMNFTLSINYAIDGQNPRGYHIVNILIHLLASLALFGLMRRLLLLPQWRGQVRDHASVLAFFIAAIWTVHPLLTQAVSYVIQRGESMAGMFVLLSAYALVRLHGAAGGSKQAVWSCVCVLAMVCAVWAKESMMTAVVGLILLDLCLLSCGFKAMIQRRWWLHALLVVTMTLPLLAGLGEFKAMAVVPVAGDTSASSVIDTRSVVVPQRTVPVHVIPSVMTLDQYPSAGFGMPGMTWKQYFFTQPAVICFYLKLAFWPSWLSLEHNWRPMTTPWAGWRLIDLQLAFGFLVTLAVLSLWSLWRRPWLGLAGCWFFLSLGVTSSIIPINDLAVEHRMYLAMVAVVSVTVLASWQLVCWLGQRVNARVMMSVAAVAGCLVVMTLEWRTFARNMEYQSELALWAGTMDGQEPNVRTHLNLGAAMYEAGNKAQARQQFAQALQLRPGNANVLMNVGSMYFNERDLAQAEKYYRAALRMTPNSGRAMVFMSRVEQRLGRDAEALSLLKKAASVEPGNSSILNALAKQQFLMGMKDDAEAIYHQVLTLEGPTVGTLINLGMVNEAQQKYTQAMLLFTRATEINPEFAPGWEQLSRSFARAGRFREAYAALIDAMLITADPRLRQHLARLLTYSPDPAVKNIPRAMLIVDYGLVATKRQDISWLELASNVAVAAGRPDLALEAEIEALALATDRGAPPEALAQGKATIASLREQVHAMQKQTTTDLNAPNQ